MDEKNTLVVREEAQTKGLIQNIDQLYRVADTMMQSGLFNDIKDAKQAVVKILAGQEYGIGPFASMKSIYIIQGNATLSAGLMASKVKAHPKYDYRIKQMDNSGCIVSFYENVNGEMNHIGDSSFGQDDARQAGLLNKENWRKYPRNMYFSRAISNGVRFYCPDVFYGLSVYAPESIDPNWIDAEITTVEETPLEERLEEGKEPEKITKVAEEMGAVVTKESVQYGTPMFILEDMPMSYETAYSEKSSDGVLYGVIETSQLANRANSITKVMKKDMTKEQREEKSRKLDAIRTLLKYRVEMNKEAA